MKRTDKCIQIMGWQVPNDPQKYVSMEHKKNLTSTRFVVCWSLLFSIRKGSEFLGDMWEIRARLKIEFQYISQLLKRHIPSSQYMSIEMDLAKPRFVVCWSLSFLPKYRNELAGEALNRILTQISYGTFF